ncbi:unnamed protein product [Mytilus edulis]|uniref:SCP domain-containing protein n=1 Tax=Mytilus edulis TaxID=6550 RepID=A0A8S3V8D8_MYTED|nr:unnamed protein product [Mytilus edulis]
MHNRIRGEVSPAASPPLPNLEWDDQLASKAEQWAQGCDFLTIKTNQVLSVQLVKTLQLIKFVTSCDKIYCVFNIKDPIHGGIKHWESEKSHWTYGNSDTGCTRGSCGHYTQVCTGGSCGHYTQIIWAATTKIGCGVYTCSQFSSSDGGDMSGFDGYKYLVCNYYQAGNYLVNLLTKPGKEERKQQEETNQQKEEHQLGMGNNRRRNTNG